VHFRVAGVKLAKAGATLQDENNEETKKSWGSSSGIFGKDKNKSADNPAGPVATIIMTGKNDTNTGYWGESATVGGEMPSGSANGDKVYILIGMGGGNHSVTTAYEYEWVVK